MEPATRNALTDGLLTGLFVGAVVVIACRATGQATPSCGGWLFIGGGLLATLSTVFAFGGYRSPPGVVGLWREEVEIFPFSKDIPFLDRLVSPYNVWLVAGLVMVLLSFLPPFLGV